MLVNICITVQSFHKVIHSLAVMFLYTFKRSWIKKTFWLIIKFCWSMCWI